MIWSAREVICTSMGAKRKNLRKFDKKYGKNGPYVYGATRGKVYREEQANKKRAKKARSIRRRR